MGEEALDVAVLVRGRFIGRGSVDRVRSMIKKIAGCQSGIPSSDELVVISAGYEHLVHHTLPRSPASLEGCGLIIELDPSSRSAELTYGVGADVGAYRAVEEALEGAGWEVRKASASAGS